MRGFATLKVLRFLGVFLFVTNLNALSLDEIVNNPPDDMQLVAYDYGAFKGYYSKTTHTGFLSYMETSGDYCNLTRESKRRRKFVSDIDSMEDENFGSAAYRNELGFDRGHLTPNGIFKDPANARKTFYLTNVAPQYMRFNSGVWRRLEKCVEAWVDTSCSSLAQTSWGIITGVIADKSESPQIINERIQVPKAFYKVVFSENTNYPVAFAYIMPNKDDYAGKENLRSYQVSLDELEEATGLSFFPDWFRAKISPTRRMALPFGTHHCENTGKSEWRSLHMAIDSILKGYLRFPI